MKVSDYRVLLDNLELKKAELTAVHDQYAYGYAKTVLAEARSKIDSELAELMSLELSPVAYVIAILSAITALSKIVGETEQLTITAKMSDGTTRDVTKSKQIYATFRDVNPVYNNIGMLTNVDTTNYAGTATDKYRIVKTSTGWNVYNYANTDGLEAVQAVDETSALVPNTFEIVDINGVKLGLQFKTDGKEQIGDNWYIDVAVVLSGTIYTSSNTSVATVSGDGLVTGVSAGRADITIQNNGSFISIPVTVT
ncbi:Ig-like domain-containing protein [Brevibacillus laterosporus]|uniref:Ig-like domain-containing protein n=1 Tax=Brevibacillus laterosporus TaxID=1465 RepID=UPI003D22B976